MDASMTGKCPECGHEAIRCEFRGCDQLAVWEGWYGQTRHSEKTDLWQMLRVCDRHSEYLNGEKDREQADERGQ